MTLQFTYRIAMSSCALHTVRWGGGLVDRKLGLGYSTLGLVDSALGLTECTFGLMNSTLGLVDSTMGFGDNTLSITCIKRFTDRTTFSLKRAIKYPVGLWCSPCENNLTWPELVDHDGSVGGWVYFSFCPLLGPGHDDSVGE